MLLAMDTATRFAGIALWTPERVLAESTWQTNDILWIGQATLILTNGGSCVQSNVTIASGTANIGTLIVAGDGSVFSNWSGRSSVQSGLGAVGTLKILDGGLPAWKAAGQPVTKDEPKYAPGTFVPAVRKDVVMHLDTMRSRYHSEGTKVIDARSPQAYNAEKGEGVFRGGHIPGAVNIPYTALFDSLDRYQPLDSIAAKFEKAGVKPGNDVIVYCGSGRTASPMYIAAKMLGFNVRLYDGSFQEWSRKEDLPVEQTKPKK